MCRYWCPFRSEGRRRRRVDPNWETQFLGETGNSVVLHAWGQRGAQTERPSGGFGDNNKMSSQFPPPWAPLPSPPSPLPPMPPHPTHIAVYAHIANAAASAPRAAGEGCPKYPITMAMRCRSPAAPVLPRAAHAPIRPWQHECIERPSPHVGLRIAHIPQSRQ